MKQRGKVLKFNLKSVKKNELVAFRKSWMVNKLLDKKNGTNIVELISKTESTLNGKTTDAIKVNV